ncbi:unnamed protein product [Rhizophagus irregularis]|nr:unnamed protein product [Rhizophagus irregularis]
MICFRFSSGSSEESSEELTLRRRWVNGIGDVGMLTSARVAETASDASRNFCHVQSAFRLFFLGPIHEEAEFTLVNTSPDKPLKTTVSLSSKDF